MPARKEINVTFDRLWDLYITRGLSVEGVAAEIGCRWDVAKRVLKEHGIHIRKGSESLLKARVNKFGCPLPGNKRCMTCGHFKSLSDFSNSKATNDGRAYACKDCQNAAAAKYREAHGKELARRRLRQHPHYYRKYRLQKLYGLSFEKYDAMLQAQGGVCAICGKVETHRMVGGRVAPLAVDHCHRSGKVRGLLCKRCNVGLGYIDNFAWARAARAYITRSPVASTPAQQRKEQIPMFSGSRCENAREAA